MSTPEHVLRAEGVTVSDGRRPLLRPTSLTVTAPGLVVAHGDPGHGHTLLALALAGRLVPDAGRLELDGSSDPRLRQRAVALVDVPGVSEPDDSVPVTTIVGEELAMAGQPASRSHARAWLAEHDLTAYAGSRVEDLPTPARLAVLTRIVARRPGVRFLVLTLPGRTGGLPDDWLAEARALAADGLGVLVTTSTSTARHLTGVPTVALGEDS